MERKVKEVNWYLWGVKVTEEEFKMPPEKVDIKKYIIEEKNAQRRMAFLKKVGMERVSLYFNGEEVDKFKLGDNPDFPYDEYILIVFDINGKKCPYLKMKNASVGVWHLEGVHPDCKTAKEAFKWRYKNKLDKMLEAEKIELGLA